MSHSIWDELVSKITTDYVLAPSSLERCREPVEKIAATVGILPRMERQQEARNVRQEFTSAPEGVAMDHEFDDLVLPVDFLDESWGLLLQDFEGSQPS